jgi:phage terminase small subunit
MPAQKKDMKIERSRPNKVVAGGHTESMMPFVRDDFDSDMEFKFAKDAFLNIDARGLNFIDVTPQIMVYAKELARYFQIMEKIGDQHMVTTDRGGSKRNPLLAIARDHLMHVRQFSHMLGIDPYTRGNMPVTLPKLPHEEETPKNGTQNKFLKKL